MNVLQRLLSESTYQELVDKLGGKSVYVPKPGQCQRQQKIVADLKQGLKPDDVAERCHVSERTVYRAFKRDDE